MAQYYSHTNSTVVQPSTPVHQQRTTAETVPKTPSSRREALYERFRQRSLSASPTETASSEVKGGKLTSDQLLKMGREELRRIFSMPVLGATASSSIRKRRTLRMSEITPAIVKSSTVLYLARNDMKPYDKSSKNKHGTDEQVVVVLFPSCTFRKSAVHATSTPRATAQLRLMKAANRTSRLRLIQAQRLSVVRGNFRTDLILKLEDGQSRDLREWLRRCHQDVTRPPPNTRPVMVHAAVIMTDP
ncbi:hypothetical protein B0H14DRAFT_2581938 [Mycena olivaceomarginata]|nr:hypothetical protein B0H14DRAFT_2581938 [Mycena olivaceomarginata]